MTKLKPGLLDYRNPRGLCLNRKRTALKVALVAGGAVAAIPILFLIGIFIYANYHQAVEVRLHFANSSDWDVVEVTGFYEGNGPSLCGYSVTGVLLAAKGRPEATVRLVFNQWTSLRVNDEISIVEMKDLDVEDVQERLLQDPSMTEAPRYQLKYHNGSIDVKTTGHFAQLFRHPIRDLKDLRTHYDDVYKTMRAIASRPPPVATSR